MKIKELRQKSPAEMQKMLSELREKLRDMRFKVSQRQLKKVREIRQTKKTISRIVTLLNENRKKEQKKKDAPVVKEEKVEDAPTKS